MQVERPLGRLLRDEPAQVDQVATLRLDGTLRDPEDLGDPGGLAAPLGVALAALVEEAPDQVAEYGRNERSARTARDKPHDPPRHRHPPVVVPDEVQGRLERLGLEAKLARVGGELDVGLCDLAQQAYGHELVDGLSLPPCPADEFPEFQRRELRRGVAVLAAAAAALHFRQGKIDPQLLQADLSLAERRPGHDKLRHGEETEAAVR